MFLIEKKDIGHIFIHHDTKPLFHSIYISSERLQKTHFDNVWASIGIKNCPDSKYFITR